MSECNQDALESAVQSIARAIAFREFEVRRRFDTLLHRSLCPVITIDNSQLSLPKTPDRKSFGLVFFVQLIALQDDN